MHSPPGGNGKCHQKDDSGYSLRASEPAPTQEHADESTEKDENGDDGQYLQVSLQSWFSYFGEYENVSCLSAGILMRNLSSFNP